jgi:hypothetical protein
LEVCAQEAINRGCSHLVGRYHSSQKNSQTRNFYHLEQTLLKDMRDGSLNFVTDLSNWRTIKPDWIKVENND